MKKIIGIVIASLVFCSIGFTKITGSKSQSLGGKNISTICVDWYKFVIVERDGKEGISIAQIFEVVDGKSLPSKC